MKSAAIVSFVFLGACATTQTQFDAGDAEAAIRSHNDRTMAGIRAGNVDQILEMYGDSAVMMPPNAPAAVGRENIRKAWTQMIGGGNVDLKLTPEDIDQSCDLAAERGRYDITFGPVRDTGKYVVVWRKINGRWLAESDIFNSDLAAQ